MLRKFATYIVNQFGVWRITTAGTCWILYKQAASCMVEMAQCRHKLSENPMRCKLGTRQHDSKIHIHIQ
jgi:hypothetical protein